MTDVPFSRLELAAALMEMDDGTEGSSVLSDRTLTLSGRAQHSAIFTPFREPAEYFTDPSSPVAEATLPESRPPSSLALARPAPSIEETVDEDELLSEWGLDGRTEDRVARPSTSHSFSLAATLAPVRFDDDEEDENERPRRPSTSMSRHSRSFDALRPSSPAFSEGGLSVMSSGTRISRFDPGRTYVDPEVAEAVADRPRFNIAIPVLQMPPPLRDATFDARQERKQREVEEAIRLAAEHNVAPDLARPVGKLYGDSLMAQLERRKAAMKAKQRVGNDDARRPMEAILGRDLIRDRELARLERIQQQEAEEAAEEAIKQAAREKKRKAKPVAPPIAFIADVEEPFERIELADAYDDSLALDDRFRFPSAEPAPPPEEDPVSSDDEDAVWPKGAEPVVPTSPDQARPPTLGLDLGGSLTRRTWMGGEEEDGQSAASDDEDDAPIAAVLEKRRTGVPSHSPVRTSVLPPSKLSLGPAARANDDFGLRSFGIGPPSPASSDDEPPVRPRVVQSEGAGEDDDVPIGSRLDEDDLPLGLANPAAVVQQQMMAAYAQQLAFAQQYAAMTSYMPMTQPYYQASVLADEDLPPGFVAPAMVVPPPQDPAVDRWRQGVAFGHSPAGSVVL